MIFRHGQGARAGEILREYVQNICTKHLEIISMLVVI